MQLRVKNLPLEAGGNMICVLSDEDSRNLGVISSERIEVEFHGRKFISIVNISSESPSGEIGIFRKVTTKLGVSNGDTVKVMRVDAPESLGFIREKIMGEKLVPAKLDAIVRDVVERHLSDLEIASFITALQIHGTSMEEVEALSRAMISTGKQISFEKGPVLDKHSIGGVPGDKTTLLVVPIVAAAGYTIPKSSSRAITSPAGTADRMEVLAPVEFDIQEIKTIVEKTGGCIVWGGALDLAPADDLFIQVEHPLSIDPLLLPSIISKKKAMSSNHIVLDIPMGQGAKVNTMADAQRLANDFIEIGNRMGMHIECAVTEGGQPIGNAVGPALEAREALEALMGRGPASLVDKATSLAGILFDMLEGGGGKEKAQAILGSGRALAKMREIIDAQGGDPHVEPEGIRIGEHVESVKSGISGRLLGVDNRRLAGLARAAGAPVDGGAGLVLRKRIGDEVRGGDVLFDLYSEKASKLEYTLSLIEEGIPMVVGVGVGIPMVLNRMRNPQKAESAIIVER
jgi:AMP phosphorylase